MKNPLKHRAHGTTDENPAELFVEGTPWQHMQQDVDPDCVRDPGSDLWASWRLEGAADMDGSKTEELRQRGDRRRPKR